MHRNCWPWQSGRARCAFGFFFFPIAPTTIQNISCGHIWEKVAYIRDDYWVVCMSWRIYGTINTIIKRFQCIWQSTQFDFVTYCHIREEQFCTKTDKTSGTIVIGIGHSEVQVLTNAILHMLCNCVFCVFVHNVKGYDSFCFKILFSSSSSSLLWMFLLMLL